MKSIKHTANALVAVCAFAVATVHAATDVTVAASSGCTTVGGNTTTSHPANGGLRATTTSVVNCPMHKAVGTNEINHIYARFKKGQSGNILVQGCSVLTLNPYGGSINVTYGSRLLDHQNGQSQSISMSSTPSSGYMTLSCVMVAGDVFYGFRYGQD